MHSFSSGRTRLSQLALSFLVLLLGALAHAQGAASRLSGTVVDTQGKAIANALVTAKGAGTTKTTRADANGSYSFDGLAAGTYIVQASASDFSSASKAGLTVVAGQSQQLEPLTLSIASVAEQITVNSGIESIAAQTAPSGGFLEERSAQSLVSDTYVQNFTSPIADYGEIVQIVPGTFTLSSDGVGLGQSKTYFRGFPDGYFDIDFDGIPFYDTNSPTHHSWAFFPAQWIGGVDFDRSPGSASTIGPTPFGGSIHLLSKPMGNEQDIRGTASYGTWNTKLFDGAYNSGSFGFFGGPKKSNLFIDVHHMSSDGYQTFNFNTRNAGSILYQYSFSPRTVLTGFSGVIWLDANTYGLNPTRCQTLGVPAGSAYTCTGANSAFIGAGHNFMMTDNSDPVNWLDYQYNNYHVPTDFEYVGLRTEFGHGWYMEVKPYTYDYDNAELFTNATPITHATTVNGSKTYNGVAIAPCNIAVVKKGVSALPCGVDKYNSYRKYGETSVLSQTSHLGVFRTGMWYEWARTNRHQYPSDPLNNWADQTLPNFAEQFWTNSYQPYAEFEYHATPKLNVTAGVKAAIYGIDVLHQADNGKTMGNLCPIGQTTGCPTTATDTGTFTAWLPSVVSSLSRSSPISQFTDRSQPVASCRQAVSTITITRLPRRFHTPGFKPLQSSKNPLPTRPGLVMKRQRFTLDGDAYRVQFPNSYNSVIDPTTSETVNFLQPSSITQGLEFETTAVLTRGLNLYINGTAANAYYFGKQNLGTPEAPYYVEAPAGLWVQQTPANTEMVGVTYESRGMDLGFFNKRVGEQRVDAGSYHNQAIVSPFNVTNAYVNYTVRNHTIFDQTKIG